MEYGLLGEHLPHSFSKIIHEKFGKYNYDLKELSLDGFKKFMQAKKFKGINITIPYKETALDFVDEIDESAKAIGAINTVINKNGTLIGFNTDYLGLKLLIEKNNITIKNKKIVILGSGGTSKTAYTVAKNLGAKEIIKVSRSKKDNTCSYEELEKLHNNADVLFNTTPVGMYPNNEESIIDLNIFHNLNAVIDVIYNPLKTNLLINAENKGIKAVSGLYMLVAQAAFAADMFLEDESIIPKIDNVYKELLNEKTNIVLIGMPASGKSTIAKELSKKLNRSFVDTDALIVEKYGAISDIFEKYGEEYFRSIETKIIKEVSSLSGIIIATGGGAVLKEENIRALKQNGKLYFLNRPLSELIPTSDRPLASDENKIKKLYNDRIDIYTNLAEEIITVKNDASFAVQQILDKHK